MDVSIGEVSTEVVIGQSPGGAPGQSEERIAALVLERIRRDMDRHAALRRETEIRDRALDVPV